MSNKQTPPASNPAKVPRSPGDLDPSFGTDGKVTLQDPQGDRPLTLQATAVTPDGYKIYVAGTSISTRDIWLIRLLADGTIDQSFGEAGYVRTPPPDSTRLPLGTDEIVILDSGKIILFGRVVTLKKGLAIHTPAATCVTEDGRIDTAFGDQGFIIFDLPPLDISSSAGTAPASTETLEQIYSRNQEEAQQHNAGTATHLRRSENELLFLGVIQDVTNAHLGSYLFKIHIDGSMDTNFGDEGIILIEDTTVSPSQPFRGERYAIDRRGGVTVGGRHVSRSGCVLVRYDSQGLLDRAFGENGIVHIVEASQVRGLITQDDGGVIFVATSFAFENPIAIVIKLTLQGRRDTTFNGGEHVEINLQPRDYIVESIVIDSANRIVIAGDAQQSQTLPQTNYACSSRLMPNGLLDEGYGVEGTKMLEQYTFMKLGGYQTGLNIIGRVQNNPPSPPYHVVVRLMG